MTNTGQMGTDKKWTRLRAKKCNQVVPGDRIGLQIMSSLAEKAL
jgi:hypothetical protein